MEQLIVAGAVIALIIFGVWWAMTFNKLVEAKAGVDSAEGVVSAHLQRRWDQLPDVAAAVRSHYAHETGLYNSLLESAQHRTDPAEALRGVLALPTLSSGTALGRAIGAQADIERQLAASRRLLASAVAHYEALRQSFPVFVVAMAHGFDGRAYPNHVTGAGQKPLVW